MADPTSIKHPVWYWFSLLIRPTALTDEHQAVMSSEKTKTKTKAKEGCLAVDHIDGHQHPILNQMVYMTEVQIL